MTHAADHGPEQPEKPAQPAADAVPADLLAILACPDCHGDLAPEGSELVCASCGLRYPVREGIPVLLVDEARRPA